MRELVMLLLTSPEAPLIFWGCKWLARPIQMIVDLDQNIGMFLTGDAASRKTLAMPRSLEENFGKS
jgi:hypothetical protein